jgi:hypothetical protein
VSAGSIVPGKNYTAAEVRAAQARMLTSISNINTLIGMFIIGNLKSDFLVEVREIHRARNPKIINSRIDLRELQSLHFRGDRIKASKSLGRLAGIRPSRLDLYCFTLWQYHLAYMRIYLNEEIIIKHLGPALYGSDEEFDRAVFRALEEQHGMEIVAFKIYLETRYSTYKDINYYRFYSKISPQGTSTPICNSLTNFYLFTNGRCAELARAYVNMHRIIRVAVQATPSVDSTGVQVEPDTFDVGVQREAPVPALPSSPDKPKLPSSPNKPRLPSSPDKPRLPSRPSASGLRDRNLFSPLCEDTSRDVPKDLDGASPSDLEVSERPSEPCSEPSSLERRGGLQTSNETSRDGPKDLDGASPSDFKVSERPSELSSLEGRDSLQTPNETSRIQGLYEVNKDSVVRDDKDESGDVSEGNKVDDVKNYPTNPLTTQAVEKSERIIPKSSSSLPVNLPQGQGVEVFKSFSEKNPGGLCRTDEGSIPRPAPLRPSHSLPAEVTSGHVAKVKKSLEALFGKQTGVSSEREVKAKKRGNLGLSLEKESSLKDESSPEQVSSESVGRKGKKLVKKSNNARNQQTDDLSDESLGGDFGDESHQSRNAVSKVGVNTRPSGRVEVEKGLVEDGEKAGPSHEGPGHRRGRSPKNGPYSNNRMASSIDTVREDFSARDTLCDVIKFFVPEDMMSKSFVLRWMRSFACDAGRYPIIDTYYVGLGYKVNEG